MDRSKMTIDEQVAFLMQGTEYGDEELKKNMAAELKERLIEELDYQLEARNQQLSDQLVRQIVHQLDTRCRDVEPRTYKPPKD